MAAEPRDLAATYLPQSDTAARRVTVGVYDGSGRTGSRQLLDQPMARNELDGMTVSGGGRIAPTAAYLRNGLELEERVL
jgi:hypothetical protein